MFSPSRYEVEVLNPLRGLHGRLPEGDLYRRYAIDHLTEAPLTESLLAEHLITLRTFWAQQARATGMTKAEVCRMLIEADRELSETAGRNLTDPAWWSAQHGQVAEPPDVRGHTTVSVAERPAPGPEETVSRRPAEPIRVVAVRQDAVVKLRWQAPPSSTEPLRYKVTRLDRPPADGEDGEVVTETNETTFEDRPRIRSALWYGVKAAFADANPPVWSWPTFQVCLAAPSSAGDRGPLAEVTGFEVRLLRVNGPLSRLQLRWRAVPGVEVRVRRSVPARKPPWQAGTAIAAEEIERYGEDVEGHRFAGDGEEILEADVPAGFFVYVPFAVRDRRAVVSRLVGRGAGQPVTDPRLRQAEGGLGLVWVWPTGATQVQVSWLGPGAEESWTVTRAGYQDDNGFRLPRHVRAGVLKLIAITTVPWGEPALSEPVSVELGGHEPVTVTWSIRRTLFRRRLRTITVAADGGEAKLTIAVRATSGPVMPLDARRGHPVRELSGVALAPAAPLTFTVEVPWEIARQREHWVRCFFEGDRPLNVVDPPVRDMKVSR
jgi:hypothetical protein